MLFQYSVISDVISICICCCLVTVQCLTICDPLDSNNQAPLPMGFPQQEPWSEMPFPSLGDIPDPGIKPTCPALAGGFFATEPPEKPICTFLHPWDFPGKRTGVGCHFLLQRIFPTQELNPGLLHCRQTLYPLSHQGIPIFIHNHI